MTDFPHAPYRTPAQIIARFENLAKSCENSNPEELCDRFDDALKMLLDARLPRLHEEHLERQIQEAFDDPRPGLSTEETFARIKEHGKQFQVFIERYRALLSLEAWESAAMMLLPCTGRTGPGYFGGNSGSYYPSIITINEDLDKGVSGATCHVRHPDSPDKASGVSGNHPHPGVAMLAAILRAHAKWIELWLR